MALALKLSQQTLHVIAKEIYQTPSQVNEMYESANLLGETRYIVLNFQKIKPDITEYWVNVREDYLHEEFEFVNPERATTFSEIRPR